MSKKPLCVAILWHMHQPDYHDSNTGEICLPWTRFHAVKDYYDMALLVEEAPGIHLTINVVPSLLDQLEAYADGTAREAYAALTLKDAADLNQREKSFLLRAFFQLPWDQMVLPNPRYKELLHKANPNDPGDFENARVRFSTRDYRDLQVWFNLAWCGRELCRNPEIAALVRKGESFSEEDKERLLHLQYGFAGKIVPLYRRLMEANHIELSVSPYYHSILPLLCDTRSAREALPGIALPRESFAFPGDAREQIRRAQARYVDFFGVEPKGMWPSEGALSDGALSIAREAGLRWLASDEGVLWNSVNKNKGGMLKSLAPQLRYCAYQWGDSETGPCLFFRDHGLSDLIGFSYSKWSPDEASADFARHLNSIHAMLPEDNRHYIVPVILDGENAWEHYPKNGAEFLASLYARLRQARDLRTVTFSEYLDLEPHREPLNSVVAGSWIYSSLSTWIGHREKNRAWELLSAARRFLDSKALETGNTAESEEAYRELMIAEGSDWFWWYGDDHQTQNAAEFDMLFRNHLKSVYRLMGKHYPPALDEPIKKAEYKEQYRNPVHTMTPRLDGKVTDYFEWLSAGFATPGGGESMHRSDRFLEKMYFGYDQQRFYVRLDLMESKRKDFPKKHSIQVRFVAPEECRLSLELDGKNGWVCNLLHPPHPEWSVQFAAGKIIELGLPLTALGVRKPDDVCLIVSVLEGGREIERFPNSGTLRISTDPWNLDQQEWMV